MKNTIKPVNIPNITSKRVNLNPQTAAPSSPLPPDLSDPTDSFNQSSSKPISSTDSTHSFNPKKSKLLKVGTGIALAGAALALSGCATTIPYYTPYGYGESTVGVTPDGTIYSEEYHQGPFGSHYESESIGPWGYDYDYEYTPNVPYYPYPGPIDPGYPSHPWINPWGY